MSHTLDPDRASELGKRGAQSKRVAAVERRIRELVDAVPPLTDAQRDRLVVLLRSGA